jgi:hypothetical protein
MVNPSWSLFLFFVHVTFFSESAVVKAACYKITPFNASVARLDNTSLSLASTFCYVVPSWTCKGWVFHLAMHRSVLFIAHSFEPWLLRKVLVELWLQDKDLDPLDPRVVIYGVNLSFVSLSSRSWHMMSGMLSMDTVLADDRRPDRHMRPTRPISRIYHSSMYH